jgi:hypothetical protein
MTDDPKSDKDMHKSGWMVPPRPNVPRDESKPSNEELERQMSVLLPTKSPDIEEKPDDK